ncbi:uncharacterized protein ASCRUDRAFT_99093 [Ascoidea rubescens DSM 1968]|uniref:(S)-ureidoglycine aminohydrolase cupin domain-containing protein n=1 Tax=Ascoidea rubescens DSM 1968 TaxID=1344418 RepID=A0A1D2VQE5_9ASCO|nr:hypothetical protein ASCRUDRAFT_99093 [Ascoidea rubescens DSM 1968]ODV63832.1 hypothetical protein ASCRUDRAFT_99093 [Ascoidea rubescens DSM 1968]
MPMLYRPRKEGYEVTPTKIGPTSFLGPDVFVSDAPEDKQISCGFYKQVEGEKLVYTYSYDEMKVILDVVGTYYISDETGYKVEAQAGDVFYFKKGTTITFENIGGYGYAWYTGLRTRDAL